MSAFQTKLYCISQIIQGLLAVFYNLGDGEYNLTLPFHRLDDGEWHEVELDRYGREFTLRLDGGGGRREVTASPGRSQEIIIDPSVVMLGNSFPSGHNRSFVGRWLLTCFGGMKLKWMDVQINQCVEKNLSSQWMIDIWIRKLIWPYTNIYSTQRSEHHS